jgi:two-component system, NtrC family, sensor kinase
MTLLPAIVARSVDGLIHRPRWWPLLIVFWAVVTALSYGSHIRDLETYAHTMATMRGRLVFELVEVTRLWISQHGGVYVPASAETPSNPYLEIPEKDIASPSGRALTKVNPSYMTRQLGELIGQVSDMRMHITSRKPIRPANRADDWEAMALRGFEERGEKESISIVGAGRTAVFRYMAPLEVKEPCLVCHEKQGYRLGDVRGGISITFPASYIFDIIDAQKRDYQIIHGVAFVILSLLTWGSLLAIRSHVLALEAARSELVENEKMASLGRMVAGFAHEANTPLGIAVGAASQSRELVAELGHLLEKEEVTEQELRERMAMLDDTSALALTNLRRAAGMVQSLKRTAVDQMSDGERDYDLAEAIEDVLQNLRNQFKNISITIAVDCPPRLRLHGQVGALEQLLTNLLTNSRLHAFDDGQRAGHIQIAARRTHDRVVIEYADDGAGMSAETLARAFEPFYTTRRGAGGSGLGLYIAYGLATRNLGGTIRCESAPGQGARFTIDMPYAPAGTGGLIH